MLYEKDIYFNSNIFILILSGCDKTSKTDDDSKSEEVSKNVSSSVVSEESSHTDNKIYDEETMSDYYGIPFEYTELVDIEKKYRQAQQDFSNEKISHSDVREIQYQCKEQYASVDKKYQQLIRGKLTTNELNSFNEYISKRDKADEEKLNFQKSFEAYINEQGYIMSSSQESISYDIAKNNAIETYEYYQMILAKEDFAQINNSNN